MKHYLKMGCVVVVSVLTASCQTMTIEDCQTANWSELGLKDGLNGYSNRWNSRIQSCQKHGVSIAANHQAIYNKAYQNGIVQYCQPQKIFNLALVGEGNIAACPESLHSELLPIYKVAHNYYQIKKDIQYKQEELDKLADQIRRADRNAPIKHLYDEQDRKHDELRRLKQDQRQIEYEIELIRPN